jgi:hypothetical protein
MKCEIKIILAVLFVTTLSSCATPKQYTQAEWDKYSTRIYKDKTSEQIIDAATKLFTLSDPDDYGFNRFENSLEAIRKQYNLLRVSHDKWTLRTYQKEDGTKAIIGFIWMAGTNPSLQKDEGTYQLFWARMDYLLGLSRDWVTCDEYQDLVESKKMARAGIGLCFGELMDDNSPEF